MNIYVGNLPYNTSEDDLRRLFEGYGAVQSAKVIIDRETGRSKGFGFVEMSQRDEAQKAIDALNDTEMAGRNLRVNEARPKGPSMGGGGGGGGGSRGGGGGGRRW